MPLPLIDVEPVLLAEAPAVKVAVGEALMVLLALVVEEGVDAAVVVPVPVGDTVRVPVSDWLGVWLPLRETEPVVLEDAPGESEAVGDTDKVADALTVEEDVDAAVPDPVPVCVPVALPVGVCDGVEVELKLSLPVLLAEAPAVNEEVGEALKVLLPLVVEEDVGAAVLLSLIHI